MDKIHKLVLQRNRAYLVEEIIIEGLWDHLESAGIFPQQILHACQAQTSPAAQIRKMLTLLEKRGPTAYPKFIECLQSAEQEHIAEHLDKFESSERSKAKPVNGTVVTSVKHVENPIPTNVGDSQPYKPSNMTDPRSYDNGVPAQYHNQAPPTLYYEAIQQPYQQNEPIRNNTPRFSSSRHKPYAAPNTRPSHYNPSRPTSLPTNQNRGNYPTNYPTNQNAGNHVTSSGHDTVSLNDVQVQSPDTTEHLDHPLRALSVNNEHVMESSGQSIETDTAPTQIKPLIFNKYSPADIEKLKQQKMDKHNDFIPSLPGVSYADHHRRNRTPTPPTAFGVSCADAPNGVICESNGNGDRIYNEHTDFNEHQVGYHIVQNPYPEQFGIPQTSGRLDLTMGSCNQQVYERFHIGDCYPMSSNPRGFCLIINNRHFTGGNLKERLGTDVDRDNLFYLFSNLGYEICKMDNLSGMDMLLTLKHFAQMQEHYGVDSCVIILLTHGLEGQVYGSDCKLAKLDEIFSYFDGDVCPALKGKPKFFIIQACRGERYNAGYEMTDGGGETDNGAPSNVHFMQEQEIRDHQILKEKLPSLSDFLVAYATVPGFVSWRNDEMGSWFVQALCETFSAQFSTDHALDMLVEVNNKVATVYQTKSLFKQMPAPVVSLRKKLYFNVPSTSIQPV